MAQTRTAEPAPQHYEGRAQWRPRPRAAALLRGLAFAVPLLASLLVTTALARRFYDRSWPIAARVGWYLCMIAIATVVTSAVSRLTDRLLPLSAWCELNLEFPEAVPSRMKTALRMGSANNRRRVLDEFRAKGLAADPQTAAVQAIELLELLQRHDRRTRGHSDRVRAFSEVIAEQLGLPERDRQKLRWASMLHDLGKLAVPAEILNKNGKPNDEEWRRLKGHPSAGRRWIEPLRPWLGEWADCVAQHHERWDGTGYPLGLAGEEISLSARIVAVADAFEVMTAARSYKAPMRYEDARAELVRCAGVNFDPQIVRAFLQVGTKRRRFARGLMTSWTSELVSLPGAVGQMARGVATGIGSVGAPVVAAATLAAGAQAAVAPLAWAAPVRSGEPIAADTVPVSRPAASATSGSATTSTTRSAAASRAAGGVLEGRARASARSNEFPIAVATVASTPVGRDVASRVDDAGPRLRVDAAAIADPAPTASTVTEELALRDATTTSAGAPVRATTPQPTVPDATRVTSTTRAAAIAATTTAAGAVTSSVAASRPSTTRPSTTRPPTTRPETTLATTAPTTLAATTRPSTTRPSTTLATTVLTTLAPTTAAPTTVLVPVTQTTVPVTLPATLPTVPPTATTPAPPTGASTTSTSTTATTLPATTSTEATTTSTTSTTTTTTTSTLPPTTTKPPSFTNCPGQWQRAVFETLLPGPIGGEPNDSCLGTVADNFRTNPVTAARPFSVRYTTSFLQAVAGVKVMGGVADGLGYRVLLDGQVLVEDMGSNSGNKVILVPPQAVGAGWHDVIVEVSSRKANSGITFGWL